MGLDGSGLRLSITQKPASQKRMPVLFATRDIARLAGWHGVAKNELAEPSDGNEMVWNDAAIGCSARTPAEDAQSAELLKHEFPLRCGHRLPWGHDLTETAGNVVLHASKVLGVGHVRANELR